MTRTQKPAGAIGNAEYFRNGYSMLSTYVVSHRILNSAQPLYGKTSCNSLKSGMLDGADGCNKVCGAVGDTDARTGVQDQTNDISKGMPMI